MAQTSRKSCQPVDVAHAGLKLPQYDASKDLQEVEDTFGPIIAQAKELADFSQKRLQEIEGEIKGIDAEKVRCLFSSFY